MKAWHRLCRPMARVRGCSSVSVANPDLTLALNLGQSVCRVIPLHRLVCLHMIMVLDAHQPHTNHQVEACFVAALYCIDFDY